MKRIFTLLCLVALFASAKAQVLFYQDFESGVLDPMTAVDVDGKTVNPNVAFAGPTFTVVQQSATNKAVVSTSWFEPVGQADDWLISPPITVTDANTFLSWEAYSPDANYRDGYKVMISTTDDSIAHFTTQALNVAAELTTWTKRSVKLTNYVGQTIYFAFRNNSTDKYLLYMDNIRVEVLKNNNVIVKSLTFEKYNELNTEVPIKISLENHGANPVTSLLFSYTIGGYPFVDTVTGLNVAPLKSLDLTHSLNYVVANVGEYPIDVQVTMPNNVADEDSTDNAISRVIYGMTEALPKKVLVEEATGTWCIWCPRGAVNMDLIASQYPDVVLPVAVHNYDPMTVADYDTPFSASVSGYPSGHVDRKTRDIDPLNFATALADLKERIVPVAVTTTVVWNPDTRLATITGTAHSSIATQNNAFRFMGIVTENDVHGTDAGYDQANIYSGGAQGVMGGFEDLPNPVPADQMTYNFVGRAVLGSFDGLEQSIPDAVEPNQDFTVEFTYEVPAEFNVENMKAIIVVMDDETGEILNGDIVKLGETTSTPLVPQGHFSAYPNPTTDVLNLQVDYQTDANVTMKIYDTNGKLIRDLGRLDLVSGNQTSQINVADLVNGHYILELRNKNAVTALPFTKM